MVETVTEGYGGPITLLTGVEQSGRITGAVVWDMEETWGLGSRALTDPAFLAQAVGRRGELTVGEELDALTGATVTSKALARGLNSAWGYVTGADANTAATEWGG